MTASLYREFTLSSPQVWQAFLAFVKANAKAAIDAKAPLRLILTTADRVRNKEQNKRLWKAVYEQIADQSVVCGKRYSKDAWHEYFAEMFLEKHEIELPNGSVVLKRSSTRDLSVSEFSDYMRKVESYAAVEMGIVFHD